MQSVDKMSPALKGVMAILNRFKSIAVGAFKAVTFPVTLLHRALTGLLSPLGLVQAALAFFAAKGFVGFFTGAAEAADKIDELSIRLGMSREALQEWTHVGGLSGVTIDTMVTGWTMLADKISEAADSGGSALNAFNELGLSAEKLRDLKPEEQFERVADALDGIANQADKTRIIRDLFGGRGGGEFLRILNQGGEAIRAMRREAHELGLLTDEQITKLVKFQDSMDRIKFLFGNLRNTLAAEFAPMLERALTGIKNFVKDNLPALKEGARSIAHFVEMSARGLLEFVKLWRDLATDQNATSVFGDLMRLTSDLMVKNIRDTAIGSFQMIVEVGKHFIAPIGLVGYEIGKEIFRNIDRAGDEATNKFGNAIRKALGLPEADLRFRSAEDEARIKADSWLSIAAAMQVASDEASAGTQAIFAAGSETFSNLQRNGQEYMAALSIMAEHNPRIQELFTRLQEIQNEVFGTSDAFIQLGVDAENAAEKGLSGWEKFGKGFQDQMTRTTQAWADWENQGRAAFDGLFATFDSGMNSMIDKAVEGTLSVKDAFKEMGKEILKILAKVLAKAIAVFIVQSLLGGATAGGYKGDPSGSFLPAAKGLAFHRGRVMKFARGGAFTNTVHRRTTVAPMAMFGEAGPEAIMPLTRDRRGRLGVTAGGSGPTVVNNYHTTINATDADSFKAMLARPGSQAVIQQIHEKSIRKKSSTREAIRKVR